MQKNRTFENNLFLNPRDFPEREDAVVSKKRATRLPVIRVLVPWKGGRSKHIIAALKTYLARPAALPADPGPGAGFPIAARLDLADVGKGMALVKEPSRAAFVRRLLAWRYFQRPAVASAKPSTAARPSPVAKPSPVAAQGRTLESPAPKPPSKGADDGNRGYFGEKPSLG